MDRRLAGAAIIFWLASIAVAEEPRAGRQKPTLRKVDVVVPGKAVEPNTSLHTFLKKWTEDASDLLEVRAAVHSIRYDKVFHIERRGKGEIGVQPGNRGWMRIDGANVEPGVVGKVGNQEYKRQADSPQEWYLTEQLCYRVNRQSKTYETVPASTFADVFEDPPRRPKSGEPFVFRGHLDLQWVFLIPPSLEQLQAKFNISSETAREGQVRLKLKPRSQQDQANFHEIQVLIDANTLRTLAVKFVDPAQTTSTVYMFKYKRFLRSPRDPLPIPVPDLKDFRELTLRQKPKAPIQRSKVEMSSNPIDDFDLAKTLLLALKIYWIGL